MKKKIIIICFVLLISVDFNSYSQQSEFPVLSGEYLGQKPPGMTPEIFAPGIISTGKGELNPMFSPDGKEFFFTIEIIPMREYKTYFMQQVNNVWSEPIVMPLLEEYKGGEPSISPDGKYLFFRSNLDESGNMQDKADIWWFERKTKKQAQPEKLGSAVNSKFNEAFPTMSYDGTLHFHSNRKGGEGAVDIYSSQFINGNFINLVNLGSNINSKFPEFHPCISPDESFLVFSSLNRPDGFGGIDLYVAFRNEKGSWTKALNLGDKINSSAMDYMPFITPDGKYLFFVSERTGNSDIYWVNTKIFQKLK